MPGEAVDIFIPKIWSYQKKPVPLHTLSGKGRLAQLV